MRTSLLIFAALCLPARALASERAAEGPALAPALSMALAPAQTGPASVKGPTGLGALMQPQGAGATLDRLAAQADASEAAAGSASDARRLPAASAETSAAPAAPAATPADREAFNELPQPLRERFAELEKSFDPKKFDTLVVEAGRTGNAAAEMSLLARSLSLPLADSQATGVGVRLNELVTNHHQEATTEVERALHARLSSFAGVLSEYTAFTHDHYVEARQRAMPRPDVRAAMAVYQRLTEQRPDLTAGRIDESMFGFSISGHFNMYGGELIDAPRAYVMKWFLTQMTDLFAATKRADAPGSLHDLAAINRARRTVEDHKIDVGGLYKDAWFHALTTGGILGGALPAFLGTILLASTFGAALPLAGGAVLGAVTATILFRSHLRVGGRQAGELAPPIERAKTRLRELLLERFTETAQGGTVAQALGQVALRNEHTGAWEPLSGYEAEFEALVEAWPQFAQLAGRR